MAAEAIIQDVERRQENDYQAQLDGLLATPLTVENINSYGDDALTQVIDLVGRVRTSYDQSPTLVQTTPLAQEEAAFAYYGLADVDQVLDHISQVAQDIRSYDKVIDEANVLNRVLLAPDAKPGPGPALNNNSVRERVKMYDRLKTTLFVLDKEFGIDVSSSERLAAGVTTDDMVRKSSYVMVDVPELERYILICDEENNASFILNAQSLAEVAITKDDLIDLTKDDIKDLIDENGAIGKWLRYDEKFVGRLVEAIHDPTSTTAAPRFNSDVAYLRPRRENLKDGEFTKSGLASHYGLGRWVVNRALRGLELGDRPVFDQQDVQRIMTHIAEAGTYYAPRPEGVLSVVEVGEKFGVSKRTVHRALKDLGEELSEPAHYLFNGHPARGLGEIEQAAVHNYLISHNLVAPPPVEGFRTVSAQSRRLGINDATATKLLEQIDIADDEVVVTKTNGMVSPSYSVDVWKRAFNLLQQHRRSDVRARFENRTFEEFDEAFEQKRQQR